MSSQTKAKRWTEGAVAGMVAKRFPSPAFAFFTQVRNGTGFARKQDRTADALAVSCYPSRGLYLVGIEIKVSRSDWNKELANPEKAEAIQQYCRHWYVAAPKGVVPLGELPATWGLIECDRSAKVEMPAPQLDYKPLDMLMFCSILRNATDGFIPKIELTSRVNERLEQVRDAERHRLKTKYDDLQTTVSEFESASGVCLKNKWDAGNIGSAVKLIREHGVETAISTARRLRDEHARIVKVLTALLEELPANGEDGSV